MSKRMNIAMSALQPPRRTFGGEAAGGNLTKLIQNDYKGSFEAMKNDINLLVVNLAEIIRQLQSNASTLAGASEELSGVSTQMVAGAEQMVGQSTGVAGATEQSTVDMASELTRMIVAQRDYTANSKVFQTGTELLDVLMNLKR